jgi:wobble nucleotide-excising tRNase
MFRKINSIKAFGVFHDFSGGSLPEFKQFNLLYGWNYSGKTTLSRVFRCLEGSILHPDYQEAQFSVSQHDGDPVDQGFTTACNVRVFNEDFRKENLRWDDTDGFKPILLLGAENIEKRDELVRKESEHQRLHDQLNDAEQKVKKFGDTIAKAERDCARQIAKELSIARFDKRHLKPIIAKWNGKPPHPLNKESFQTQRRIAISAEEKAPLPPLDIQFAPIDENWSAASNLLTEQISSKSTIQRLVDYPDIGGWVEHGLRLHADTSTCEFCANPLGKDRIEALNAHFSDAFENLKERVSQLRQKLESQIVPLDERAYVSSAFYIDLQTEHENAFAELKQARELFNGEIRIVCDLLKQKEENPFQSLVLPNRRPNVERLHEAFSRFAKLIEANNERTRKFAQARNAAVETLKNHYAAEAMRKINRFGLQSKIDELEETIFQVRTTIKNLEQEIAALRAELSDAAKGAETINDTLLRFFGKADIQVKVTDEGNFLLMRGEQIARNLSEGERTAIAFCYFVTKLSENGNDLSDTIVYIDDPISSLDAHHLLHIGAFIRDTFYKFDGRANPKHQCLARQLFISTHNYEFFHLTWEWMKKLKDDMVASYLIERTDSVGLACSRIVECPDSVKRYRSEYLFLFHCLSAYMKDPNNDPQVIFNIGNMARRFFESYVAFKFLEHTNVDGNIGEIIADPIQAERARKFMHFYSHTFSRGAGMNLPDMSEAQEIIGILLNSIEAHDPVHYNALEAAC